MSVLALLVGFFLGVCEDIVIILNQYFFSHDHLQLAFSDSVLLP